MKIKVCRSDKQECPYLTINNYGIPQCIFNYAVNYILSDFLNNWKAFSENCDLIKLGWSPPKNNELIKIR